MYIKRLKSVSFVLLIVVDITIIFQIFWFSLHCRRFHAVFMFIFTATLHTRYSLAQTWCACVFMRPIIMRANNFCWEIVNDCLCIWLAQPFSMGTALSTLSQFPYMQFKCDIVTLDYYQQNWETPVLIRCTDHHFYLCMLLRVRLTDYLYVNKMIRNRMTQCVTEANICACFSNFYYKIRTYIIAFWILSEQKRRVDYTFEAKCCCQW